MNPSFWQGRRVFLTGHTGFKGGWLCIWLQSLGAELTGFALEPNTEPNLFTVAKVGQGMHSVIGDIRDLDALQIAMRQAQPNIVIHMAAQPLVRFAYAKPLETYATNVMGTAHVLEATRRSGSARAVVNVTTDKCYENREWEWGYRENEPLGGFDPYSSSKACSELISSAYRRSFLQREGIALATARAGNVIGGGDWAEDRLVPDMLRAFAQREPAIIRNPDAIRPWQHVLEPLSGYLTLAERLCSDGERWAQAWNFGPLDADARPVRWLADKLATLWHSDASWQQNSGSDQPHEAHFLKLDVSKARSQLGWSPRWGLPHTLAAVVDWHKAWLHEQDMKSFCLKQINDYQCTATLAE